MHKLGLLPSLSLAPTVETRQTTSVSSADAHAGHVVHLFGISQLQQLPLCTWKEQRENNGTCPTLPQQSCELPTYLQKCHVLNEK